METPELDNPQTILSALIVYYDTQNLTMLRTMWNKLVDAIGEERAKETLTQRLDRHTASQVLTSINEGSP